MYKYKYIFIFLNISYSSSLNNILSHFLFNKNIKPKTVKDIYLYLYI